MWCDLNVAQGHGGLLCTFALFLIESPLSTENVLNNWWWRHHQMLPMVTKLLSKLHKTGFRKVYKANFKGILVPKPFWNQFYGAFGAVLLTLVKIDVYIKMCSLKLKRALGMWFTRCVSFVRASNCTVHACRVRTLLAIRLRREANDVTWVVTWKRHSSDQCET